MVVTSLPAKKMLATPVLVSLVIIGDLACRNSLVFGEEDDSGALSFDLQAHNTAAVNSAVSDSLEMELQMLQKQGEQNEDEAVSFDLQAHDTAAVNNVLSDSMDMELQMLQKQFEQEKQQLEDPDSAANKINGEEEELELDQEMIQSDSLSKMVTQERSREEYVEETERKSKEEDVEEDEREEAAQSLVDALQSRLAKRQKTLTDYYDDKSEEDIGQSSENDIETKLDLDKEAKQWLSAKDAEDVEDTEEAVDVEDAEDADDADDTEETVDLTSADPSRIFNDHELLIKGIGQRSGSDSSEISSSKNWSEFNLDLMSSTSKPQTSDTMFKWYDQGDASVNAADIDTSQSTSQSRRKEDQEDDPIEEEVDTEGWLGNTSDEKVELDSRIHSLDSSGDDDECNDDRVNPDIHMGARDTAHEYETNADIDISGNLVQVDQEEALGKENVFAENDMDTLGTAYKDSEHDDVVKLYQSTTSDDSSQSDSQGHRASDYMAANMGRENEGEAYGANVDTLKSDDQYVAQQENVSRRKVSKNPSTFTEAFIMQLYTYGQLWKVWQMHVDAD